MINDKFLVSEFVDELNDGIIYIDKNRNVKIYNNKAREILGFDREFLYSHKGGKIQNGDIVILAMNDFGAETNGIEYDELSKIGVVGSDIKKGDAIIVAGIYNDKKIKPIVKISPKSKLDEYLEISSSINGISFSVKMDFYNRKIIISALDKNFEASYVSLFTHGLIINKEKREVKFYQAHGYTAWGETLKEIFSGKSYNEKVKGMNTLEFIGKDILEFHDRSEILDNAIRCANGEKIIVSKKRSMINDIEVIYSLKPVVRDNILLGSVLIIGDTTMVRKLQVQRDITLRNLKETKEKLYKNFLGKKIFPKLIGSSEGMIDVKKLAFKAGRSQSNILLLGESGTGKSILARCIHEVSDLKNKPFIKVNCNSIPENLLESELFGYVKGAFTGANKSGKKGLFEMADGGTIFLDEIGELSLSMQVKLLHVIQNKQFYKVGGNSEIKVDVRVIVATNRNLENDVKEGKFREDLYYRINVFPITVLPLKERKEDIYDLVEKLLPNICAKVGTNLKRISGEAYSKMMAYHWPGNIRELENVLERAVNICDGENILSEDIRINIKIKKYEYNSVNYLKPLKEIKKEVEYAAIKNVMRATNGNKKEAMEILEIKKTSFYQKLSEIENSEKKEKDYSVN